MPTELFIVLVLKALVEITGMFMIGQGVLYLFAGNSRQQNFIYQLFSKATTPVMKFARMISPGVIADKHIWIVAVAILFWAWVILLYFKFQVCLEYPAQCGTSG
jgi:hypothetical protein